MKLSKKRKLELKDTFDKLDVNTQNSIVYISSECRLTKIEVTNIVVGIQDFMLGEFKLETCELEDWSVEKKHIQFHFDMNNGTTPSWGFQWSFKEEEVNYGHHIPNFVFQDITKK